MRHPRHLDRRRRDPLKRRSLEEWRQAFAQFDHLTDALICAGRKVLWDYPATAPLTTQFTGLYHRLAKLPPPRQIEHCLVRLGYHPHKAQRALIAWGQSYKVREKTQINAYERHLCSLVPPAYRDNQDTGSVSVLDLQRKGPSNA